MVSLCCNTPVMLRLVVLLRCGEHDLDRQHVVAASRERWVMSNVCGKK